MTSLQCVEAFSPAQPGEEQNHEGYGPQSGQYLHSCGGAVTYVIVIIFKCIRAYARSYTLVHGNGGSFF